MFFPPNTKSEVEDMSTYNLCGKGSCCPQLHVGEQEVKIGENEQMAVLDKEQWNNLVELIKVGKVGKI